MSDSHIRLGLVGEHIGRSLAPRLYGHLARLHGLTLSYELIDGAGVAGFDPVRACRERAEQGYVGVNVTQPFKRALRAQVTVEDPRVARIGSVNTVLLGSGAWRGTNTDYSGFLRAYRARFGKAPPGSVVQLGAGGVGRAVAFALHELGARAIQLYDVDAAVARDLAEQLRDAGARADAIAADALPDLAAAADGIVNCTPVGMHYRPGLPVAGLRWSGRTWAFDAIYTPLWTPFLQQAREAGVATLSGFELFLFQGLDGFRVFTGRDTPHEEVRAAAEGWLAEAPTPLQR